jgi:2-methylcitrate dehydratase PrpD
MHPGWAAQAAISAVDFAAHGIPAPQAPYEGRYGFYCCYLGQEARRHGDDLALATTGLVAIKPFPMCHFVHASADAAIALHRSLDRSGIDAARIRSVEVAVPSGVAQSVCEPVANKRRPKSDDAKFSLNHAVASGLLRGRLGRG